MTRAGIHGCARELAYSLAFLILATATQSARADSPAQVVKQVSPDYPDKAVAHSVEGWVELEFVVDTDGKVRDVSVLNAEPAKMFESSAVRAIQKWVFSPALRNGAPVESQMRRKFTFKQ
ncbi:MAG: energy transducer TonB [Hydrocarboniphaga sp.]|uniref:energy transducer TonB n=1 Tax=Hydrocarboniphaga sp. TaxID=2033016 RepID=UPI00262E0996|nr:energy transducer TonB [Hydrocarboniphaga sp.]MDB5971255.1 energy transducer TonB [Hydrocarboniphaga sp.]